MTPNQSTSNPCGGHGIGRGADRSGKSHFGRVGALVASLHKTTGALPWTWRFALAASGGANGGARQEFPSGMQRTYETALVAL